MSRRLLLLAIAFRAFAQTTPEELARAELQRWSTSGRKPGLSTVVRSTSTRAIILLSGVPVLPNSGDATFLGRAFSGVYQARTQDGRWTLGATIPLDRMGRILHHQLNVSVRPGSGLVVEDTLRILVRGGDGFALRLNHAAKLESVSAPIHHFGGGLLWVDLPAGDADLTLRYSIDVEKGGDTNSGCFLPDAGHVRAQYFWHPFFDFSSVDDLAAFDLEARIPSGYRLHTSLPQSDRIEDGVRIVTARTVQPTVGLTLVYDNQWLVEAHRFGPLRLETFLTSKFEPASATVAAEFNRVYNLLTARFGAAPGARFTVLDARSFQENPGWRFASNQTIVAAGQPKIVSMQSPLPAAPLAHEIAHFWTLGTGPAANFLGEGWAVYAESLALAAAYGAEAADAFWKYQGVAYLGGFDGKQSILEDPNNSGIAYFKGSWIFRMLEDAMGSDRFDKAIADYSRISLARGAGWEILADCAQRHAPPDFDAKAFLTPWLAGKTVPHLTAQVSGHTVAIRQDPPGFQLPLVIEAETSAGKERRRIWLKDAQTAITFPAEPTSVRLDPAESLLLRR